MNEKQTPPLVQDGYSDRTSKLEPVATVLLMIVIAIVSFCVGYFTK